MIEQVRFNRLSVGDKFSQLFSIIIIIFIAIIKQISIISASIFKLTAL